MNLDYCLYGLISFVFCLLFHIFVWRFYSSLRKLELLFGVFSLPILISIPFCFAFNDLFFAPLLMHLILSVNYIAIYPAFQAESPTVTLLCYLKATPLGASREEIASFFSKTSVVNRRIIDLVDSRLILKNQEGDFHLSLFGRFLVCFFKLYRKCLGLQLGVG